MRHRLGSRTVLGALLLLWRTLVFAQPAAALNADYWRVGWRTPLGDGPHIYEFLIRANRVTGVYCRNCADASTIGFIDGTWSETAGIDFTVTFANADGRIRSVEKQHAALTNGRLIISGAKGTRSGKALTLVKDPRGADPGGAPAYYLPPGTPPARPVVQPAAGGGGRGGAPAPYWPPGPFKALRPSDIRKVLRLIIADPIVEENDTKSKRCALLSGSAASSWSTACARIALTLSRNPCVSGMLTLEPTISPNVKLRTLDRCVKNSRRSTSGVRYAD
jgi:hypothetical protein